MGMLESVIGGVLGQVFDGRQGGAPGHASGGAMSPLVKALIMLLLAKGASSGASSGAGGGFGDIFGGARQPEPDRSGGGPLGRAPAPSQGGGDIGGFDQSGGRRDTGPADADGPDPSLPGGGYDDLSGMLGGGAGSARTATHGPAGGSDLDGLDGLVGQFRNAGLGDVIGSWIGNSDNHPVAPDHLARALGDDTLGNLERETGMDRNSLLSELSQALPAVVNALTPQGRMPDADERKGW